MNYTSIAFLIFFGITFTLYYALRDGAKQVALLVIASLIFYAWEAPSLLVVFLTSWAITAVSSYYVLTTPPGASQKRYATAGVVINLSLLAFFKYKTLIDPTWNSAMPHGDSPVEWLLYAPLPIGISFYTFHGISLLVDIYRGNKVFATRTNITLKSHLFETLLYLVFFPQLISGPIIKAKDFLPQVQLKTLKEVDFKGSARILIVGVFLKSVIADNLSSQTYWIAHPYYQWKSSADLLILLYGYSAQIFADFAGYSLIAVGLAKLMGYNLPHNFNFPYFASSISEFWRKWHISLSSWLRDYLYIPLGGNQKGEVRTYVNLITTMFLGGLWHGAAWSFAIWGLWHGIGLALERPWMKSQFMSSTHVIPTSIRIFIVFNFVTMGWLLFKLQDFRHAIGYFDALLTSDVTGVNKTALLVIGSLSSAVFLYHLADRLRHRISMAMKDTAYGVMLFFIITSFGPSTPFIYFQF